MSYLISELICRFVWNSVWRQHTFDDSSI